jgi:hypothetical protein
VGEFAEVSVLETNVGHSHHKLNKMFQLWIKGMTVFYNSDRGFAKKQYFLEIFSAESAEMPLLKSPIWYL